MFYCWDKGGIRPTTFYNMDIGEKMVLCAFYEFEIDQQNKQKRR